MRRVGRVEEMSVIKPAHPFYMIRHGETDWNAEQRFQGHKDIPINTTGRRQAAAYAQMMGEERLDLAAWWFMTSPLCRTRTTMQIMRAELGLEPDGYAIDPELIEVTFGDWEGHTIAELKPVALELVAARSRDKWRFIAPGGESYAIAAQRVRRFLERLDRPAIIVTHGGIIRSARHLIEGIDGDTAARDHVPQDNIYHFDGERARWLR